MWKKKSTLRYCSAASGWMVGSLYFTFYSSFHPFSLDCDEDAKENEEKKIQIWDENMCSAHKRIVMAGRKKSPSRFSVETKWFTFPGLKTGWMDVPVRCIIGVQDNCFISPLATMKERFSRCPQTTNIAQAFFVGESDKTQSYWMHRGKCFYSFFLFFL